ncbi:MAG: AAA family ATPase [Proteobacteria bacterium]|nr:AAA family ATPase [Pseudomonadota bacterium]
MDAYTSNHLTKSLKSYDLKAIDLHEFIETDLPTRDPILSPWLLNQSLVMIHSWRGIGKTHVALGIAYAVASGGSFLGWEVDEPKKVLLLDGEMPGAALQERFGAIIASSEKEAAKGMLKIATPDIQELCMPDLSTEDGQLAVDKYIEPDTSLIIVDNLSSLCRSGKENEADSWSSIATWALRQRASGRSVLFIHHSGKDLKQRGTSKREDILDVVISLRRPADYSPTDGACFEVHFEKARHLYGEAMNPIEAKLTTDEIGLQSWLVRTVEDSTIDRVVALAKEGLSQKEIADELEVNKSTVSRHFRKAKGQGLIG